ncbi:MAG: PIN domain-containing protein [Candidatus Erginobacter occultus]|nr:PIN domain-containing protein [Candidatus Erginobacter occultus]
MNEGVFIDTSGFYAILVKADDLHQHAVSVLRRMEKEERIFVTTDYVLDETATLIKARGHGYLLRNFFDIVFRSLACRIHWTEQEQFKRTVVFMLAHQDRTWSFTDCLSFCLMKDQGLRQVLTKDRHFFQAGFEIL